MNESSPGSLSRCIRVRVYRKAVRNLGQVFRLAAGSDMRQALRRAALAAVPQNPGWSIRVFSLERTAPSERLALVLDGLARQEMGRSDFAAALAATQDGSMAVLAVTAKDIRRLDHLSKALGTTLS